MMLEDFYSDMDKLVLRPNNVSAKDQTVPKEDVWFACYRDRCDKVYQNQMVHKDFLNQISGRHNVFGVKWLMVNLL